MSEKTANISEQLFLKRELSFPYFLVLSALLHLFVLSFLTLPYYFDPSKIEELRKAYEGSAVEKMIIRDVIVNINQDNKKILTEKTLLSDQDSSAKGYLTKEKGDNWLNNSLTFMPQSSRSLFNRQNSSSADPSSLLLSPEKTEYNVALISPTEQVPREVVLPEEESSREESEERQNDNTQTQEQTVVDSEWGKIPDRKGVTLENAIFYSNTRQFSFNTKKFTNFEYFRKMKQKIANNWFPPIPANNDLTTGYTPGRTRVRVIGSQIIKTYFIMNRDGEIQKVVLVDSMGNHHLDDSCLDAIKNSKTFGPVPDDIPGEEIVIPFIFGYYVR
jgi:TonB family protein